MKEEKILKHLKNSLEDADHDVLKQIKEREVEKMTEHDDITRQKSKKKWTKGIWSLAGVAAVVLFSMIFYHMEYQVVDNTIFFDINPSIRLTTNKHDQVIGLEGLNDDGKILVSAIDYKKQSLTHVTQEILEALVKSDKLMKSEEVLLVSVYNEKEKEAYKVVNQVEEVITTYMKNEDLHAMVLGRVVRNIHADVAEALKDLSPSKQDLIMAILEKDQRLKPEELIQKEIADLVEEAQVLDVELVKIDHDLLPEGVIDPSQARAIALNKVEGEILDIDLDDMMYEVEILAGDILYQVKINALSGQVESFEGDDPDLAQGQLSLAEVKAIALGKVVGDLVDFEVDDDLVYHLTLMNDGLSYELEIDGITGEILDFERDGQLHEIDYISEAEALAIALNYRDGRLIDIDFEDDDQPYYEIELLLKGTKFEIKVDAITKQIFLGDEDRISMEDIISQETAMKIAQDLVEGRLEEVELDQKNDRLVYEIDLSTQTHEYDVVIDAITGQVIDFYSDADDDSDDDDADDDSDDDDADENSDDDDADEDSDDDDADEDSDDDDADEDTDDDDADEDTDDDDADEDTDDDDVDDDSDDDDADDDSDADDADDDSDADDADDDSNDDDADEDTDDDDADEDTDDDDADEDTDDDDADENSDDDDADEDTDDDDADDDADDDSDDE
jgi:uncharacterized membrane protein YkoI